MDPVLRQSLLAVMEQEDPITRHIPPRCTACDLRRASAVAFEKKTDRDLSNFSLTTAHRRTRSRPASVSRTNPSTSHPVSGRKSNRARSRIGGPLLSAP